MNSKRMKITCSLLALSTTTLLQVAFASDDSNGANKAADDSKVKYKGRINNSKSRTSQSDNSGRGHGEIMLRADIESSDAGLKCDVMPYYTAESKLTAEQFGTLSNSPLAVGRVALWKAWYSRIFEEVTSGQKIPTGLREKINVTVTKNHKVTATVEWMDPSADPEVQAFAKNVLQKIRSLETAAFIEFPEKSYLELVSFDVYVKQDGFQLANGLQKLDID